VGIGTSSPTYKLQVAGNFTSTYVQVASGTGSGFLGASLTNAFLSGGVSFLDSQGINSVTDSHMFFNHGADYSSSITFATQPAGANTDRRVTRLLISGNGNLVPGADDSYSCGVSGVRWSAIWAANGTIQTSDARAKTEISNSVLGLDFIQRLRPVSYKWIEGGRSVESITTDDENGDPVFNPVESIAPGTRRHFGLIAQEVKEVLPEGVDFGGWVLTDKDDPDSQQALRYDQFIAPLIKAIQELSAKNDALEARIAILEAQA
jgi:hypothetical protein